MSSPFDDAEVRRLMRQSGVADELKQQLPPLLAADGIVLNDPSTMNLAPLNEARGSAVERRNSEGFVAMGINHTSACSLLSASIRA